MQDMEPVQSLYCLRLAIAALPRPYFVLPHSIWAELPYEIGFCEEPEPLHHTFTCTNAQAKEADGSRFGRGPLEVVSIQYEIGTHSRCAPLP